MTLVERIRLVAEQNGTNFKQIEETIGIGNGNIRRWDTSSPRVSTFLKVADLLNVSTDYLLRGHEFGRVEKIDDELFALVASLNQQHKSELKGYINRMLEEESVAAEEGQKPQKMAK